MLNNLINIFLIVSALFCRILWFGLTLVDIESFWSAIYSLFDIVYVMFVFALFVHESG